MLRLIIPPQDLVWVVSSSRRRVCICGFYFSSHLSYFFHNYENTVAVSGYFDVSGPMIRGSPKTTRSPKYFWSGEHLNNMLQMMVGEGKNSLWFLKLHIMLFLFQWDFDPTFCLLYIFLWLVKYRFSSATVIYWKEDTGWKELFHSGQDMGKRWLIQPFSWSPAVCLKVSWAALCVAVSTRGKADRPKACSVICRCVFLEMDQTSARGSRMVLSWIGEHSECPQLRHIILRESKSRPSILLSVVLLPLCAIMRLKWF